MIHVNSNAGEAQTRQMENLTLKNQELKTQLDSMTIQLAYLQDFLQVNQNNSNQHRKNNNRNNRQRCFWTNEVNCTYDSSDRRCPRKGRIAEATR